MAEAKKKEEKVEEKEEAKEEEKVEEKEEKEEIELSKDAQKVMDMIEKMTVLELNDLVKALEDKFGVSASAPVMMGAMPGSGNGDGNGAAAEEKSSYNVELTGVGDNKIAVIKAVRTVDQTLGLVDAKKLVESAPKVIAEDMPKEEAEAAKKTLEEAGAKVELK